MSKCLQRQHTSWSEKSLRAPPSKVRAASCSSLQPPPSSKDYQSSTFFKDRQCYQVLYKNTTHDTSFPPLHKHRTPGACRLRSLPIPTGPHTRCSALKSSPGSSSLVTSHSWMLHSCPGSPNTHLTCILGYRHEDARPRAGFSLFGLKHCNLFIRSYVSPDFKHRNAARR